MVTLAIGQRVQQSNTVIWEIVELGMRDRYSNEQLWRLRMIEDPRGLRSIGENVHVSASWLNLHCIDVNMTVEPPKGNGKQVCYIVDALTAETWSATFTTAEDAINWFEQHLEPELSGSWYGWEADDFTTPDMEVHKVDGELVWSE